MWAPSKKRCISLQKAGGYYNTNTHFIRLHTLPMRYDNECLDYSLDISGFLQDSIDRICLVKARAEGMLLQWLSYANNCIIFGLAEGNIEGTLFCYFETFGGRSFQLKLIQPIQKGLFPKTDPPIQFIPNLIQFSNTQPLSSTDEAFFFFG